MAKQKGWTTKEIKFIQDNYDKITVKTASVHLKRDKASVRHQAYRLGCKFKQEWEVQEYAYYKGDDLICFGQIDEICEFTGISRENLLNYRYDCYQKVNRRLIAI